MIVAGLDLTSGKTCNEDSHPPPPAALHSEHRLHPCQTSAEMSSGAAWRSEGGGISRPQRGCGVIWGALQGPGGSELKYRASADLERSALPAASERLAVAC